VEAYMELVVVEGRGQAEPALSQNIIFTKLYLDNKTFSPHLSNSWKKNRLNKAESYAHQA